MTEDFALCGLLFVCPTGSSCCSEGTWNMFGIYPSERIRTYVSDLTVNALAAGALTVIQITTVCLIKH